MSTAYFGDPASRAIWVGMAVAPLSACAECIGSANAHRVQSTAMVVCDLYAGPKNIVNLLSVITSAAMLMYKVRVLRAPVTERCSARRRVHCRKPGRSGRNVPYGTPVRP